MKFHPYNNALIGIETFIGTMLGLTINTSNLQLFGSSFFAIFAISGLLRLIVSTTFINKIKEEKILEISLKDKTYKRFITIRPQEGLVFEVIGHTIEKKKTETKDKKYERQKV
ncbi:MAG: hypothetical protein ACLFN8_05230 [Candidatus Woesearchaeota archaeon]